MAAVLAAPPHHNRNMRFLLTLTLAAAALLHGQADSKQKIKSARELYKKNGAAAVPGLQGYLKDSDPAVRREAARLIVEAGTPASLEALLEAAQDADGEIQEIALAGLVNVYAPGYANRGNLFGRTSRGIKGAFTDTNDRVIERYIVVRPEVQDSVTRLIAGGATLDAKAAAARAAGVLRVGKAVPALAEAVKTKEPALLYESLVAIQKIGDPAAAPAIAFLLQDLNERVQVAAIETTGLLRNKSALPGLREALNRAKGEKVRAAALTAIGMMPEAANRSLYETYLTDKDDDTRASAAEGYARLANSEDRPKLTKAYETETKMKPRLAMAFGAVMTGDRSTTELAPFSYLVNTLNSSAWHGVAFAYLEEAARQDEIRSLLYAGLPQRTRAEKTELAGVLARSGDNGTVPVLEALSKDPDSTVAVAGAQALRNLRARLTP
jgi:HEAT repeat protein